MNVIQLPGIIPTLNERDSVEIPLEEVIRVFNRAYYRAEILLADGGSSDGTEAKVAEWTSRGQVCLLNTHSGGGCPATSYSQNKSRAEEVVVMDADLSDSPQMIPAQAQPVLEGTHEHGHWASVCEWLFNQEVADGVGVRR